MRRAWSATLDAFNNLRRAPSMAIAIVVVSAVSLVFMGVSILINNQVSLMKGYWYDRVEVSIFLAEDVTDAQRLSIETALEKDALVDEVFYETKAQAYAHFQEQFESSPELVDGVTEDQLPESFRVKLVDPERFSEIRENYELLPGVDVVQDQKKVLESFFKILQGVQTTTVILALTQVATALILISNTVRVAAMSRRRETRIMRLVGAPRAMIAMPFILEGAIAGFLGGVLSSGVLVALKVYLVDGLFASSNQTFSLVGWDAFIPTIIITVVTGVVLAVAASALSIFRHLKV